MKYKLYFSRHEVSGTNPAISTFAAVCPTWIIDEKDKNEFLSLEPHEFVIVISDQARKALTPEELESVIAHELGHFVEGHLSYENLVKGIRYNDHNELQADAYAIKQCGAKALYKGLRKVVMLSCLEQTKQDNLNTVESYRLLRQAMRQISPRIAAIRAAM